MRVLALSVLLALWISAPQAQTIGLFADPLGTDCNLQIPFPGSPVAVYAVATLAGPAADGVSGASFRIEGLPAGWTAVVAPGPNVTFMNGDPFSAGALISLDGCVSSQPLVLWTALITPTSYVENTELTVVAHATYPPMCSIENPCSQSCPFFCDCDVWGGNCICAETLPSHINGDPCVVAVPQHRWGQVKQVYR